MQDVSFRATPQVETLVLAIQGEMTRSEAMDAVGLKDRMHFVYEYLQPALDSNLIEMTIPNRPRSSKQRYRLTAVGRDFAKLNAKDNRRKRDV